MSNVPCVIFIGAVDWRGTSTLPAHHVVRRLSERACVHYLDNFGGGRTLRISDARRAVRKLLSAIQPDSPDATTKVKVHQPLVIPVNALRLSKLNGMLLRRKIIQISRCSVQPPIIWTRLRTPLVIHALEKLPRSLLVVHEVDDSPRSPHFTPEMRQSLDKARDALTRRADLVFASARGIAEERKNLNANTHFFPNGVAASVTKPCKTSRENRTVVFAGHLGDWVDVQKFSALAQALPTTNILIAGASSRSMEALNKHDNIKLFGALSHKAVLDLMKSGHVGIIPYHITDFTKNTFPSKLFEYLASGLHVVSTPLPEVMNYNVAQIGSSDEEFVECVRHALELPAAFSDSRRVHRIEQLLREHDWDVVVNSMWSKIEQALAAESGHKRP